MASISSKSVHTLVQQLDSAALLANKEVDDANGEGDGYAALLLESLGIDNWITIMHTYMTAGEEATKSLIRQLHEDLPSLLETDAEEEGRASDLARMISKTLSWVDSDKNVLPCEVEKAPEVCKVNVPALVRSNPLICFDVFSEEEQQVMADSLENLQTSQIDERSEFTDGGDYFIPTDTPRMIEYRVSDKQSMMWKTTNINNLAPLSICVWAKLVNLTKDELSTCETNAINGVMRTKIYLLKDSIKMTSFRDKYRCSDVASVRIKLDMPTDSSRPLQKHKSALWNWHRPYLRCNCKSEYGKKTAACKGEIVWLDHAFWYILNNLADFFPRDSVMAFLIFLGSDARDAVLSQVTFMYTRQLMIKTACEIYSAPKDKTLIRYGDAAGIRMLEKLIKPASFSDNLVSNRIQNSQKKRPQTANPLNLNTAPTRFVPNGRGRGRGRLMIGRNYNTPRSGSSSNRSASSSVTTSFSNRPNIYGRGSPIGRRNLGPYTTGPGGRTGTYCMG
ncbi:hypothetical protein R1sor_010408 [Riccia sorocarpa]|uniref:Uncharacterized protein n=1 Tax=Riccia sorocarpa TaxID=122646 RepID=A0ABD3HXY4_9MARC